MFLGGGTPNAYGADDIAELLARLQRRFGRAGEVSIEVNPELVRAGDFARYRDAGVTRLSIGVQSFERGEIETLGRKHVPEQIEAVVAQARAARHTVGVAGSHLRGSRSNGRELEALARSSDRIGRRSRLDVWAHGRRGHAVRLVARPRAGRVLLGRERGRTLRPRDRYVAGCRFRAVRDQQLRAARPSLRAQSQLLGQRRIPGPGRRRRVVSRGRPRLAYALAGSLRRGGPRRRGDSGRSRASGGSASGRARR